MHGSRTRLAVFGESTIFGFGVRENSFGAQIARRLGLEFTNHAGFGATIRDSLGFLEDADEYAVAIAMHGTNEAMVRPTARSLRFMPRRWRRRGWMDPRAYYPTSWRRALPKRIESATRWRMKVALIRLTGGMNLVPHDEFERLTREFVAELKRRGVPTIILIGSPVVDERYFPYSPAKIAEYSKIVKRIAGETDVIFVDAAREMRQWEDYYLDHLHASASGHARLTARIEEQLVARGILPTSDSAVGGDRGEHGSDVAGPGPVADQRERERERA